MRLFSTNVLVQAVFAFVDGMGGRSDLEIVRFVCLVQIIQLFVVRFVCLVQIIQLFDRHLISRMTGFIIGTYDQGVLYTRRRLDHGIEPVDVSYSRNIVIPRKLQDLRMHGCRCPCGAVVYTACRPVAPEYLCHLVAPVAVLFFEQVEVRHLRRHEQAAVEERALARAEAVRFECGWTHQLMIRSRV